MHAEKISRTTRAELKNSRKRVKRPRNSKARKERRAARVETRAVQYARDDKYEDEELNSVLIWKEPKKIWELDHFSEWHYEDDLAWERATSTKFNFEVGHDPASGVLHQCLIDEDWFQIIPMIHSYLPPVTLHFPYEDGKFRGWAGIDTALGSKCYPGTRWLVVHNFDDCSCRKAASQCRHYGDFLSIEDNSLFMSMDELYIVASEDEVGDVWIFSKGHYMYVVFLHKDPDQLCILRSYFSDFVNDILPQLRGLPMNDFPTVLTTNIGRKFAIIDENRWMECKRWLSDYLIELYEKHQIDFGRIFQQVCILKGSLFKPGTSWTGKSSLMTPKDRMQLIKKKKMQQAFNSSLQKGLKAWCAAP